MTITPNIAPLLLFLFLGLAPAAFATEGTEGTSGTEALLRVGRVGEALEAAARVSAESPDDMAAQEIYIDLLLSFGMAPRAERIFRERARTAPTDPDAWYLVGRAVAGADDAREAYERALRFEPTHPRSHMGMAAVHTAAGRSQEAVDAYQRAVSGDATLAEAWLGLVRAHIMGGDVAGAMEVAVRAEGAVPQEPGVYIAIATLDPAHAGEVLARGAVAAPGDARIRAFLAEQHLLAGDSPAALKQADEALALDPTLAEALRAKLFAEELVKAALTPAGYRAVLDAGSSGDRAAWDVLVEAHPRSAIVRAGRARHLEQSGDLAGAGADLETAIRLDPRNVEVQAALGLLRLRSGYPEPAAPLLASAWSTRPWDVSLALALAEAHARSDARDEADRLLGELAKTRPFDLRVGRVFAQHLLDTGRPEEAYRFCRQRLGRVPDPQLGVALIAAALATERDDEAASFLEEIGRQNNRPALIQAAQRLRERSAGG